MKAKILVDTPSGLPNLETHLRKKVKRLVETPSRNIYSAIRLVEIPSEISFLKTTFKK